MNASPQDHEENLKKAERIAYLIAGHLRGTLTPAEQDELDDWITDSDENLELFETLTDADNIETAMQRYLDIEKGKAAALAGVKEQVGLLAKRRPVKWLWLALPAASLLVAAAGLYFFTSRSAQTTNEKPIAAAAGDLPAGTNKAILTLSNGRTLILDSIASGLLATEGTVQIAKGAGGEIRYTGTAAEARTNQVSTPRGGQYKVLLSDGTAVWLNAESALKYPAAFTGATRDVELRGEGYFDVARNVAKPFQVKITAPSGRPAVVKVLGTHFNINSYGDEGAVITTLLEGAVEVQQGGDKAVLRPGEAALIEEGIVIEKVAAADAAAWKEGRFIFRDATIKAIGEQIKRWYDVEVVYEGRITQHFNTTVSRAVPLSKLLNGLEGTGEVRFTLHGRTLFVKP